MRGNVRDKIGWIAAAVATLVITYHYVTGRRKK